MMLFVQNKKTFAKLLSLFFALIIFAQANSAFAIPIIGLIPTDPIPPVPIADSAIRSKEVELTVMGRKIPGLNYDVIAITALRALVNALGTYTVNWINNDFKSSPNGVGFPLDLEKTLKNTGDAIAGKVIADATGGALCSPISIQIEGALKLNQSITSQANSSNNDLRNSCPISLQGDNLKKLQSGDFIGAGGWDSWYAMTQDANGNGYSSMLNIQARIDSKTLSQLGIDTRQLDWGKGFLSSQGCIEQSPVDPKICLKKGPVKTPGSIVEGQLQKVFGSEVDQLNVASNFNQVVTALVGKLQSVLLNSAKGLFNSNSGDQGGYGTQTESAPTPFGVCSPDKQFVLVGQKITWTYSGFSDNNTRYAWSGDDADGDGALSATTSSVTFTYTTPGLKKAYLKVTQKTATGDFDTTGTSTKEKFTTTTSNSINCTDNGNTVTVSKYGPLKLSCDFTPTGAQAPGTKVIWTVTIFGGSGKLNDINFKEKDSFGGPVPIADPTVTKTINPMSIVSPADQWNLMRPFWTSYTDPNTIPIPKGALFWFKAGSARNVDGSTTYLPISTPALNADGALVLMFEVTYRGDGQWPLSFDEISDVDPYVPVLSGADCGKKVNIRS